MVSIFDFQDYRKFLSAHLQGMAKKGYGQHRRLAESMGVHTTLVSQIFRGSKNLTVDQAVMTSEFFGLNELESEYFVGLVSLDRAGNEKSRKFMRKQLQRIKKTAKNIDVRLTADSILSEADSAIFYSDWSYSAIRQMTAIEGFQDPRGIATSLGLSVKRVRSILDFLIGVGLCKEKGGVLSVGPASTRVEATSPWARVHKVNWHGKAISSLDNDNANDLMYSMPMTLSEEDVSKIRERLIKILEEIGTIVDPSPSEVLYCLNLNWFRVNKVETRG